MFGNGKKLYCLAIFARRNGLLVLTDAVEEEEDLFLKTMVGALVDVADQAARNTLITVFRTPSIR